MATDTPENEPLNTDKANDGMIKVLSISFAPEDEQKDDGSDIWQEQQSNQPQNQQQTLIYKNSTTKYEH